MRLSDRRILLLITRKRGPFTQIHGDVPEKALDHVHPRAERRGGNALGSVYVFPATLSYWDACGGCSCRSSNAVVDAWVFLD